MKVAASLLVADPKIKPGVAWLLRYDTLGTSDAMFSALKGFQNGLWVGGDLTISPTEIHFQANALNRAVNENGLELTVPKSDIVAIRTRRGFGAGIIDFVLADSVLSIKCWRPNWLKNQINSMWSLG